MVLEFTDGFEYRPMGCRDAQGGPYFKKADGWTRQLLEEALQKLRKL